MGRTLMYVAAAILFLIGLCLVGYGALNVVGSTSAQGNSSWMTFGIGFAFVPVAIYSYLYSVIPLFSIIVCHAVSVPLVLLCGCLSHKRAASQRTGDLR